jgi:hypothetical protein
VRAAEAMIAIANGTQAPRHLPLGVWGYNALTERLAKVRQDMEALRELSVSADFPA